MSNLPQSIVTSHKEAAKRATEYLQGARNLKLKPPEALELVARVLGVANWQTLLGMAKEGQAPRAAYSSETPVSAALSDALAEPVPSQAEPMHADGDTGSGPNWTEVVALAKYYRLPSNAAGQHPRLTSLAHQAAVAAGETTAPYWEWVLSSIYGDCGLLPWDADALESCQIARAAGVTLNLNSNGMWFAEQHPDIYIPSYYADSEEQVWDHAAQAVDQHAEEHVGTSWTRLEVAEKVRILERQYCRKSADGLPSELRLRQVFLTELEEICQAARLVPAEVEVEGQTTWATEDRDVASLEEALAHQVALIGKYVTASFDWDGDEWNWLPAKKRVLFARRHAAVGSTIYYHTRPQEMEALFQRYLHRLKP